METKEQKPWYHGVKWTRKTLGGVSTVLCDERPHGDLGIPAYVYDEKNGYCVAYPFRFERAISEGGGFEIRMDFVSFDHDKAELIAATPETATERDRLLSVNKQLVEALEKMVQAATYGTFDYAHSHPLPLARAAILAAKASS